MNKAEEKKAKEQKQRKGPSLLEWVSAAIGAVITLALLGFILLEAIGPSAPVPTLTIRPLTLAQAHGSYILHVEVTNRSGETAAAVNIEGELKRGGQTVETSNATISYVPGHSTRRAGLIFARDPRHHSLALRPTGFEVP